MDWETEDKWDCWTFWSEPANEDLYPNCFLSRHPWWFVQYPWPDVVQWMVSGQMERLRCGRNYGCGLNHSTWNFVEKRHRNKPGFALSKLGKNTIERYANKGHFSWYLTGKSLYYRQFMDRYWWCFWRYRRWSVHRERQTEAPWNVSPNGIQCLFIRSWRFCTR